MNQRQSSLHSNLSESGDEIVLSALMANSLAGDSKSYIELLQKVKELMQPYISNSLAKFGLAATGGHEDLLQEILMAIHSKRATFDTTQFFLPWMYAIARYKTIDFLRKNKSTFKAVSIEEFIEFEVADNADLGADIDIESLCDKLPEKQRELLLLVKVKGLSIAEASMKTGFSISDVKVTVHRAIKELQKHVKENGNENR